ncbi:uncharacterized protein AMSG_11783 [Thecamonas trahens ATCC 50062]|uniref:non-specific serine/threonine protein kinase n=1 Tax=Thecamonas trahens ATCC 50062 TaxID=461836 RepID=A0A0L0D4R3_THETB|nr:hypothetical protein AMSG_11783 [Thecamonas trahens ATCC 50062]KNC47314.1 hypothetical protein AMSG_11783 [Thecamonas trahens ATCC 50062]|eukprot:XP_013759772.1 hypothetical protein AMSG_11783 [Thecamonas trahens ATCC 50062]
MPSCCTGKYVVSYHGGPVAIVAEAELPIVVPPTVAGSVTYVEVRVQFMHTQLVDLQSCSLVAPIGTSVALLIGIDLPPLRWDVHFDDGASVFVLQQAQAVFRDGVRRKPTSALSSLRGSLAAGTWRLKCEDTRISAYHGFLYNATLILSTSPASCGDGEWFSDSEACDDGNTSDGDGCSSTCSLEPGFSCSNQDPAAPTLCTPVPCGDGTWVPDVEECDDGNTMSGDGCSSACKLEHGYACNHSSCRPIVCGDSIVDAPTELCDDGNAVGGDGCSAACSLEASYTCDTPGEACNPLVCGNGIVQPPETCDDGNVLGNDGCASDCTIPPTCLGEATFTESRGIVRSQYASQAYTAPLECVTYVRPTVAARAFVVSIVWFRLRPGTLDLIRIYDVATTPFKLLKTVTADSAAATLAPVVVEASSFAIEFVAANVPGGSAPSLDSSLYYGFVLEYYALPQLQPPSGFAITLEPVLPPPAAQHLRSTSGLVANVNLLCNPECVFYLPFTNTISLYLHRLSWPPGSGASLVVEASNGTVVARIDAPDASTATALGYSAGRSVEIAANSSSSEWAMFVRHGVLGAASLPFPVEVQAPTGLTSAQVVVRFSSPPPPPGWELPHFEIVYSADSTCLPGVEMAAASSARAQIVVGPSPQLFSYASLLAPLMRCVWGFPTPLLAPHGYTQRLVVDYVDLPDPQDSLQISADDVVSGAASVPLAVARISAASLLSYGSLPVATTSSLEFTVTTGKALVELETSEFWPSNGFAVTSSWGCGLPLYSAGHINRPSAAAGYLSVDASHAIYAGYSYSTAHCAWRVDGPSHEAGRAPVLINIMALALSDSSDVILILNGTSDASSPQLGSLVGNAVLLADSGFAALNELRWAAGLGRLSSASLAASMGQMYVPSGQSYVSFVPGSGSADPPTLPPLVNPLDAEAGTSRNGFLASYQAGSCIAKAVLVGAQGIVADGSGASLAPVILDVFERDALAAVSLDALHAAYAPMVGQTQATLCHWRLSPPTVPQFRYITLRISKLALAEGASLAVKVGGEILVYFDARSTRSLSALQLASPLATSDVALPEHDALFGPAALLLPASSAQPRVVFAVDNSTKTKSGSVAHVLELVTMASELELEWSVPRGANSPSHMLAGYQVGYTCPPGAVQASAISTGCAFCEPGMYLSTLSGECTTCETGTFSLVHGAHAECWTCPTEILSLPSAAAADELPERLVVSNTTVATSVLLPLCMPSSFPVAATPSASSSLSMLVVGLIGIGLGLVFMVLVGAACFTVWRRRSASKIDPESMLVGRVGYEITYDEITFDKAIGTGSYGEVWRGLWRGTDVAIKRIHNRDFSAETLEEFRREAKMMCDLRHPNVVLFMGACTQLPNLVMVTEYLERGNLFSILHDAEVELPYGLRVRMLLGAASGINFLHSATPPILHNDLKSLNLLVTTDWNVKVADFGLTCIKDDLADDADIGTAFWTAPEVLNGLGSSTASDVYSFGIIMWEVLTRETLYDGVNPNAVMLKVSTGELRPHVADLANESKLRTVWRSLMVSAWQQEPESRPTFGAIVSELKALAVRAESVTATSAEHASGVASEDGLLSANGPASENEIGAMDVSFIFADIKDMAALWDETPAAARDAIEMFNTLVDEMLEELSGYRVESREGAFVVSFSSSDQAMLFATSLMLKLHNEDRVWPPALQMLDVTMPGAGGGSDVVIMRGLRLAIGIHTGVPSAEINPVTNRMVYTGPVVRKATLVAAMAVGGQVVVSEAALRDIKASPSSPPFAEQSLGLCLLPGFDEPETVTAVLPPQLAARLTMLKKATGRSFATATDKYVWQSFGMEPDPHVDSMEGQSTWERVKDRYVLSSMYRVRYEDVEIVERCGMGTYGELYRCRYRGEEVAMKRLLRKKLPEALLLDFKCEVIITAQLNHPNIVTFLGACTFPYLCLVTEFCTHGSVHSKLTDPSVRFDWPRRVKIAHDIAKGMHYLHSLDMPIMHRDLKTPNVLLDSTWTAKLCDFGLARIKSSHSTMTKCGTIAWTAPEVLTGKRYSLKADVYSFGLVLWELVTAKFPYIELKGTPTVKIVKMILNGHRPNVSREWPKGYVALMKRCWSDQPKSRPTFSELLVELTAMIDNFTAGQSSAASATAAALAPASSTSMRLLLQSRAFPSPRSLKSGQRHR